MQKSAIISPCGLYRYHLSRFWGPDECSVCCFIGLNPSTADANLDDPTIRRCINFAKAWGFDGLWMVNLFAFRATKPGDMKGAADPVGPDNDDHLGEAIMQASLTIAAWGVHGSYKGRDKQVIARYGHDDRISCLGLTKDGHPKHPLYLKADTKPWKFQ